jgi:hypothetical protein
LIYSYNCKMANTASAEKFMHVKALLAAPTLEGLRDTRPAILLSNERSISPLTFSLGVSGERIRSSDVARMMMPPPPPNQTPLRVRQMQRNSSSRLITLMQRNSSSRIITLMQRDAEEEKTFHEKIAPAIMKKTRRGKQKSQVVSFPKNAHNVAKNPFELPENFAYLVGPQHRTPWQRRLSRAVLRNGLEVLTPHPIELTPEPTSALQRGLTEAFADTRVDRIITAMKLQHAFLLMKILEFESHARTKCRIDTGNSDEHVQSTHDTLKTRNAATLAKTCEAEKLFKKHLPNVEVLLADEKKSALTFYETLAMNQLAYMKTAAKTT